LFRIDQDTDDAANHQANYSERDYLILLYHYFSPQPIANCATGKRQFIGQ
jgi:hypothetical protein